MTNLVRRRRSRDASLPQLIQKPHPRILAAAYPNTQNTAKPPTQLHRPGIARRYHVLLASQYPLTTESLLGGRACNEKSASCSSRLMSTQEGGRIRIATPSSRCSIVTRPDPNDRCPSVLVAIPAPVSCRNRACLRRGRPHTRGRCSSLCTTVSVYLWVFASRSALTDL